MKKLFKISGLLSLIYYVIIIFYAGIRTTFAAFWIFAAAFSFAISQMPGRILKKLKPVLAFTAAIPAVLMGCMIYAGRKKPSPGADYVVILGAQVRGKKPSRSLLYRIEAAACYLKENPGTKAIASGGQGAGEDVSEAYSICETLISMGIEKERLIEENQSVSTWQNLKYSMVLGGRDASYVIVTNNFHVYRALKTAGILGMKNYEGFGAHSHPLLQVNYYAREMFALGKLLIVWAANKMK